MCPAVIFAASRTLTVKGRTITLMDSMIIRKLFGQSGAQGCHGQFRPAGTST